MNQRRGRNRRESSEAKEEKRSLGQLLEMPVSMLQDYAQMELYGNREIVIDGCRGILEYNDDSLRLNLGRNICRIQGRTLQVKCMTADSVVIEGYILSVEFLD